MCINSATCCIVAEEIFRHDAALRKTGIVCADGSITQSQVAVEQLAGSGDRDAMLSEAAGACPVAAIRLYDMEGRRLLPDELVPME